MNIGRFGPKAALSPNLLRRALCAAACALPALFLAGAPAAMAQAAETYPNRLVRMVVPFPAGGPADFVGRLYAQHLGQALGQTIIVENPSGAAGTIGTRQAATAAPDGYTVLFGSTSTMSINQILMKNLPYDYDRDFSLIGLIANAPHALAIRSTLPYSSVAELVEAAKKQPGKYSFSSAGIGTIVQMGSELFKLETGVDLLHVPFKGGYPATMALLSGDVDITVNDLTTLKGYFDDGRLRALAVAHTSRLAPLPDVPTFAEVGLPGMVSSTWWGIAVPTATPAAIQQALRAAHEKVVADPAYVARLAEVAVEPLLLDVEQSRAFIQAETEKWRRVVEKAGIQLD